MSEEITVQVKCVDCNRVMGHRTVSKESVRFRCLSCTLYDLRILE